MAEPATFALQSGANEWSAILALAMGMMSLGAIAVVILLNRFNRPDLNSEHAGVILTQLDTFGGSRAGSVVVKHLVELDDPDIIGDIRGLFHGERSTEARARQETTRAVRQIIREVRDELGSRTPNVSKVPARALYEAVLTALLGAIAIVPVAVWREATRPDSSLTAPNVSDVVAGGQAVLETLTSVASAFPYLSELFGVALTFGIIGVNTIWTLWMVPPVALVTLATVYWLLERRVDTDRPVSGPSIRAWSRRFIVLAVLTWTTGAALATIGGVIPGGTPIRAAVSVTIAISFAAAHIYVSRDSPKEHEHEQLETEATESDQLEPFAAKDDDESNEISAPEWKSIPEQVANQFRGVKWTTTGLLFMLGVGLSHEIVAVAVSLGIAFIVTVVWTLSTLDRWLVAADEHGRDALGLDIVHSLTVTVAALTLPLMVGYALAAIGTGKALSVARVVISAPPLTVWALAALAVVSLVVFTLTFSERFADARRGLKRALSVHAVRAVIMARALPILAIAIIAILGLATGQNPVFVVAIALTGGVVIRLVWMTYNYVSFRAQTRDTGDSSATRVVISGRQVRDADGEAVYVADVNGHRTAHRDLDQLVKQIQRDTRSLLRDGEPERGSFARYYYKNGVLRGHVDMEHVADELLGDVRTRFVANVKQSDADAETILEKLHREYPSHVVRAVVRDLKEKNRVTRREDRFQWLGR